MTVGILLTWHNQESVQWSPDPFPRKRVGSGYETKNSWAIYPDYRWNFIGDVTTFLDSRVSNLLESIVHETISGLTLAATMQFHRGCLTSQVKVLSHDRYLEIRRCLCSSLKEMVTTVNFQTLESIKKPFVNFNFRLLHTSERRKSSTIGIDTLNGATEYYEIALFSKFFMCIRVASIRSQVHGWL